MILKQIYIFLLLFFIPVFSNDKDIETALKIQKQIQKTIAQISPAFVMIGAGSGVLISEDGYIVTNEHVIRGLDSWEVRIGTGQKYRANVIGKDRPGDLCLLKIINNPKKLPWLALGDSDKLKVGQWVFALGNPFLYAVDGSPTVSLGIISSLHRYQDNYADAIQTDAALNPGNSGGPLINLKGEIVGINGRIAPRFQNRSNSKIGFAISSNQIKKFLPLLRKGSDIAHGKISGAKFDVFYEGEGVKFNKVEAYSDIAKRGFLAGDVIIEVDDFPIKNIRVFLGRLWTYPAFTTLTCKVRRGKKLLIRQIRIFPK